MIGVESAFVIEGQGRRPHMEDTHVLRVNPDTFEVVGAIFDGHLGASVSKRAAGSFLSVFDEQRAKVEHVERALYATFDILQEEAVRISSLVGGGACACAFYASKDKIVTANLGDAEIAFLPDNINRGGGIGGPDVDVLTIAHRLDNPDEILRVYHTGAVIKKPYFLDPATGQGLMPTRALGDTHMDKWGMSHRPTLSIRLRKEDMVTTFYPPGTLIAACDGFWDVIQAEDLDDLTRHEGRTAQRICQRLYDEAMTGRATTDNLTVMCVRIE